MPTQDRKRKRGRRTTNDGMKNRTRGTRDTGYLNPQTVTRKPKPKPKQVGAAKRKPR